MLKIKDTHKNTTVIKNNITYFLDENSSQEELKHFQIMLGNDFIESEFKSKSSHKSCKGSKELGTACNKPYCKNCNSEE